MVRLATSLASLCALAGCMDFAAPKFARQTVVPPSIVAVFPRDGELAVSPSPDLTVVFSKQMNPQSVLLSSDPALEVSTLVWDQNDQRLNVLLANPLLEGASYALTLSALDNDEQPIETQWSFSVAAASIVPKTPPAIAATTPANMATGTPLTQALSIAFTKPMREAVLSLSPSTPLGLQTWNAARTVLTQSATTVLEEGTTYTVTIEGVDEEGLALDGAFSFTTFDPPDTTQPEIVSRSPVLGATMVPTNAAVVIGFSEPMIAATVDVRMTDAGGTVTMCNESFDATKAFVTCDFGSLPSSQTVTISVQSGATDLANNAIAGALSHTFTTSAAPDMTAPTLATALPTDTFIGAATTANLQLTFSEAMNPESSNALSVMVGGVAVAGVASWTNGGTTLVFDPTFTFGNGVTVEWSFGAGARDASNNALTGTSSGSFRVMRRLVRTLESVAALDGYIYNDSTPPSTTASLIYVGDTTLNSVMTGYLSFDLNELHNGVGTTRLQDFAFISATLSIALSACTVNPSLFGMPFARSVYYGASLTSGAASAAVDVTTECVVPDCNSNMNPILFNNYYPQNTTAGFKTYAAEGAFQTLDISPKLRFDWERRDTRAFRSQWRLQFVGNGNSTTDMDGASDNCRYHSGSSTALIDGRPAKPKVEVTYELP